MKTSAVLVGTAVGDALGMPFERYGKQEPQIHPLLPEWDGTYQPSSLRTDKLDLPPGHWTDDTEMSLALTEAILAEGKYNPAEAAKRYVAWFQGTPHGIGGTTRTAMERLIDGWQWHESGVRFDDPNEVGCGTAMRIAPLGVLLRTHKLEGKYSLTDRQICAEAMRDAAITHNNKEAEAASVAVAYAVSFRFDYPSALDSRFAGFAVANYVERTFPNTSFFKKLIDVVNALENKVPAAKFCEQAGSRGNVLQLVPTALYCAFAASSFEEGVQTAVRAGGDADSRGAIAGAILGARFGLEGIPAYLKEGLHLLAG